MKISREEIEKTYEACFDDALSFWKDFLRFKSVSANPSHQKDCIDCVNWLKNYLESIGFKAEVIETGTKPILFAEYGVSTVRPAVLYYGHYDVQPADPLDLWESDPFEPEVREERVYARGAVDNKGQTAYFLKAMESLIKEEKLSCGVKLLIEGEEETASVGLIEVLPEIKDKLQADILVVCDSGSSAKDVPTITMGLKGVVALNLVLHGPNSDLHSGIFGACIKNPAAELSKLISGMFNGDGSVAVDGFYDGMIELSAEDQALLKKCPADLDALSQQLGVPLNGGEEAYSVLERMGVRPTIDVNGIHSGYSGFESKTVLPAKAETWLTARIVSGQDPEKVVAALERYFVEKAPEGMRVEVVYKHWGAPAVSLSSKMKSIAFAGKVMEKVFDKKPAFHWLGGSIPIVSELSKLVNGEALLVGFWESPDAAHAPNESFSFRQFKDGFLFSYALLKAIGDNYER